MINELATFNRPNGTKFAVVVADDGTLSAAEVTS